MSIDIRDLELNALLEITQAINNNLSEDDLYKIYRFTVLGDLKVKKLVMYVKDDDWTCKVDFGTTQKWSEIPLPDKYKDFYNEINDLHNPPFNQFEKGYPIMHKDRLLAIVFIGGFHDDLAIDSTFLIALTNILIVAIENKKFGRQELQREAYRKELEIAKKVQNFLFPKTLPQSDRLKIQAMYMPHNDVGGDYYDYIPIGEQKFIICIADVSGKGVPAALLMSNFQASLRALTRKTHDLKEIVNELNHSTCVNSNGDHFITLFIALYDFSSHEMDYVNCGHNPAILLNGDACIELESGTTILGMFEPLPFLEIKKITKVKTFLLFGYTDGLSEAFNPEDDQFGSERIVELIKKFKSEPGEILQQNIIQAVDDFRQGTPLQDDITMISCCVES